MKKNIKREGFTLVELLIVIVVIGVLSAMMMLSSTEAVSSAKAADIVSDLRNLKTAALAYYADNLDAVGETNFTITTATNNVANDTKRKAILKYMNNENVDTGYKFAQNDNKEWFVYYDGSNVSTANGKVNEKLVGRASSTGLLASATKPTDSAPNTYAGGTSVYMFIR